MARNRAFELRVALDPGDARLLPDVTEQVRQVLGEGWTVVHVAADSPELVALGPAFAPVGTTSYAHDAFAAARELRASGQFAQVEADVPVPWTPDPVEKTAEWTTCTSDSDDLGWARATIRWQQALDSMDPAVRGGVGVSIGHPDSGYTLHPQIGADTFDLVRDRDVIDDDDDALDDLTPNPFWPLPNPGHGTSTASVIAGRADPSGIAGVAPAASVVPVRATESVVQLFDSDVAAAVSHARRNNCQVVSMSLGGKGFFGLRREIDRAVAAGMIVMAAAGNVVRFVTAPASYDSCLAVAATGPGDVPWPGSSRGTAVDVSMPGHCVWVAGYDGTEPVVARSNGTSYSVAHLAGAATLWIAHHGHAALVARYGAAHVQGAFLATLRRPGVCVVPQGWDRRWGIGRVDVAALLAAALPDTHQAEAARASGASAAPGESLAATVGLEPAGAKSLLEPGVDESELVYRAMTDPVFAASLRAAAPGG